MSLEVRDNAKLVVDIGKFRIRTDNVLQQRFGFCIFTFLKKLSSAFVEFVYLLVHSLKSIGRKRIVCQGTSLNR